MQWERHCQQICTIAKQKAAKKVSNLNPFNDFIEISQLIYTPVTGIHTYSTISEGVCKIFVLLVVFRRGQDFVGRP